MRQIYLRKIAVFLIVSTAFFYFGCNSDDSRHSHSDPDAIVEYDAMIGGIFEGDETAGFPNDIEPLNLKTDFNDNESNDLSNSEISQAPDFSMDYFATAYEEVLANFPSIDQSSDEFARKIIIKIASQGRPFTRPKPSRRDGILEIKIYDPLSFLTPEEKELVLHNPLKAIKGKYAAVSAEQATITLFGENGWKKRSDAFRHSYWNWLMSKSCGIEWTRSFTNAHESEGENNDDKRMDLNNNMIGRRVFNTNSSANDSQAQEILLNYKLLWINEEQKNVVVGIDYLVYLSPIQKLTVFDSGPDYDDIYNISFNGNFLGITPQGGSRAFVFSQIPSGTYNADITCQLDGTQGGCGFKIIIEGALGLTNGDSQSSPIVIQQNEVHNTTLIFPVMKDRRVD